jgi:hypothetical protein
LALDGRELALCFEDIEIAVLIDCWNYSGTVCRWLCRYFNAHIVITLRRRLVEAERNPDLDQSLAS